MSLDQAGVLDLFVPETDPAVQALHDATACYTQSDVVEDVLDAIGWPASGGRLLDPGAGDGAFAVRAIARLGLAPNDVAGLTAAVEAWEIHPLAAQAARDNIVAHLHGRGWILASAIEAARRVVREADFLAPGPRERRYTHVAGNPPYLRTANLPVNLRARYEATVPDYARADILHAFIDRCSDVLLGGGAIGMVTADRWLFNMTAAKLREQLGQRLGIARLVRLDATSAFYKPKTRTVGSPPRVHPVVVVLREASAETPALTRAPVYPGAVGAQADGAVLLSDLATVKLAPWLGPHGIFTLDMDAAGHLPAEALVPCVDTDDVVRAEATDGRPRRRWIGEPKRFAIRTSRAVQPHAAVEAHLRAVWDRLPRTHRRDQTQAGWWVAPENFGPLPLACEALLVPRIAKRLVTIRLRPGLLPINHNLSVVWSNTLRIDELERLLTGEYAQRMVAARAPRLENGYLSITTTLLREMPVIHASRSVA